MDLLVVELEKHVEETKKFIKKQQQYITLKYNERDGHYMIITQRRCKILKANLEKLNTIKIGSNVIKISDFEFIDLPKSNNTKIYCKEVKNISNKVVELKLSLTNELKNAFYSEITKIITEFSSTINSAVDSITMLDFLVSGATCSYNYGI